MTDSIFDSGPADEIPLPDATPSWDALARRHRAAAARFEALARKAGGAPKEVGRAVRDGLVFEAASHACAALVGVGLWPLVETAAHVLTGWVLG